MHRIQLVADSAADLWEGATAAPLKILTDRREYVDDPTLDVRGMVDDLQHYKGRSSTSCPNADDWLAAFGDAERVICITITGTLSGSYNAACLAKDLYEEQHPDRRVFVFNSLTAGPEIRLLLEKAEEGIAAGEDFDTVCERVKEYSRHSGLVFVLESMKNLANNGRVSPLVAKMAGFLGIRLVGKASDRGDLEPLCKCRGDQKVPATVLQQLRAQGYAGGKVRIAHCFNEPAAHALRDLLHADFPAADIVIYPCRGLCSFYAEKGGLLVGFER